MFYWLVWFYLFVGEIFNSFVLYILLGVVVVIDLGLDYRRIVEGFSWKSFDEYVLDEDFRLSGEVSRILELTSRYRERIMGLRGVAERIKSIDSGMLGRMRNLLYSGRVSGVDGTLSLYPTPTGYKCRIGVVSVNYVGDRVEKVVYVSDENLIDRGLERIEDVFENIESIARFSPLLYKSIMLYKEREIALNDKSDWRLVHGPLIPLELRLSRLGVDGVLETNLELAVKLIEDGHIIGVLSSSSRLRLLNIGYLLKPGEYMYVGDIGRIWEAEMMRGGRNPLLQDFIKNYGDKVSIGLFKAYRKVYVFEACKKFFDEAGHLVMADSLPNRFRGFPFLLDYADRICRSILSSEEFSEILEYKLMLMEGDDAFMSIDERRMRG